jgi:alpha-methylacyl-CoA racemase
VGPLHGVKVVELAGLGPAPMTGMMLADMGAEVIRIERGTRLPDLQRHDVSFRGKRSVALNLKDRRGVEVLLRLVESADILLEGFRPGVAERLGVGPEDCRERNPRLVYGRMTGWGQEGPLAQAAGHDINYVALAGALHAIGRPGERPVVPLNLIGDMGGGGMLLAFGVICALFEAQRSGKGQVVDAAMIDGVAQLLWLLPGLHAVGAWNLAERGVNLLDGGAHFYDTYETADGRHVAVGAIEPQFYRELMERLGLDADSLPLQQDPRGWPELRARLAEVFRSRTRDEWCALLEGTDACFAPVLALDEAPDHPHHRARGTFIEIDGVVQHAPSPRFSRTAPEVPEGMRPIGGDGEAVLASLGYSDGEIRGLGEAGVLLLPAK